MIFIEFIKWFHKFSVTGNLRVFQETEFVTSFLYTTVKLGFKEQLDKEQLGNSEPFSVTNMPVYLINSEQIGFSGKLCDD